MPQAPLLKDANLDPALAALIDKAPMPPLDSGHVDRATSTAIAAWLREHPETSPARQAGLWLLAGDLHQSHTLSQDIHTAEGSYWHGIMHRREGDFENAKYWFRRVGPHPVLTELAEEIEPLRSSSSDDQLPWDELRDARRLADALVDCCRRQSSPALEEIAWREWQLLFRYC